jgi:hypothetical protein
MSILLIPTLVNHNGILSATQSQPSCVLYTQTGSDISIVKASRHGLGYLYPPKDGFKKDAEAPEWIVEAWDWLLRNDLELPSNEPSWFDLPALKGFRSPRRMWCVIIAQSG